MRKQSINKIYRVTLTDDERTGLRDLLGSGEAPARTLTHARILLKADESAGGPGWTDDAIHAALDVGLSTIVRVRERFVAEGFAAALHRRPPRRDYQHLVDGTCEAHLVALACSAPPAGHGQWTLRLLADKLVELRYIDHISHETVRQVLKKTNSSPG
jgi:Homeodomain-like domain